MVVQGYIKEITQPYKSYAGTLRLDILIEISGRTNDQVWAFILGDSRINDFYNQNYNNQELYEFVLSFRARANSKGDKFNNCMLCNTYRVSTSIAEVQQKILALKRTEVALKRAGDIGADIIRTQQGENDETSPPQQNIDNDDELFGY